MFYRKEACIIEHYSFPFYDVDLLLKSNSLQKAKNMRDGWKFSETLERIITLHESRITANEYVQRLPQKERDVLENILKEWDREEFSREPGRIVIRNEAIPVIRAWLQSAKDYEVIMAKNFLMHLSYDVKEREKVSKVASRLSSSKTVVLSGKKTVKLVKSNANEIRPRPVEIAREPKESARHSGASSKTRKKTNVLLKRQPLTRTISLPLRSSPSANHSSIFGSTVRARAAQSVSHKQTGSANRLKFSSNMFDNNKENIGEMMGATRSHSAVTARSFFYPSRIIAHHKNFYVTTDNGKPKIAPLLPRHRSSTVGVLETPQQEAAGGRKLDENKNALESRVDSLSNDEPVKAKPLDVDGNKTRQRGEELDERHVENYNEVVNEEKEMNESVASSRNEGKNVDEMRENEAVDLIGSPNRENEANKRVVLPNINNRSTDAVHHEFPYQEPEQKQDVVVANYRLTAHHKYLYGMIEKPEAKENVVYYTPRIFHHKRFYNPIDDHTNQPNM